MVKTPMVYLLEVPANDVCYYVTSYCDNVTLGDQGVFYSIESAKAFCEPHFDNSDPIQWMEATIETLEDGYELGIFETRKWGEGWIDRGRK